MALPSPAPTLFELQLHPANVRRRVRCLRLTRRHVNVAKGLVAGLLLLLVAGALAAPRAVSRYLQAGQREGLGAAVEAQRQRQEQLGARLSSVAEDGSRLRRQLSKISLAYGLAVDPPPRAGEPPSSVAQSAAERARAELGAIRILMERLTAFETARPSELRHIPAISPLAGSDFVLTVPFGPGENPFTREPQYHPGVDFAARQGASVRAPADGVVLFAGQFTVGQSVGWWRRGNVLVIAHGNNYLTVMGHLGSLEVRAQERVRRGQRIGSVGATGVSSGPHLYYEVRRLGVDGALRPVDPRLFVFEHSWQEEEAILASGLAPAPEFDRLPGLEGPRAGR